MPRTFKIHNNRRKPLANPNEELARAMVEGATEYDWDEVPVDIQALIKHSCAYLRRWMNSKHVIEGDIVVEVKELEGS